MKSQQLLLVAALASVALAAPLLDNAPAYNQAIIDEVNAANTTWTAGFNGRFFGVKMSAVRSWLGVLPDAKLPEVIRTAKANDIPDTFDSRTAWPKCASISTIRDQANCGSCWAFGAVEAMSDRICIASGQTNQVQLSAQHLVSCTSPITGHGCGGGYPGMAWLWWATFR
jgi:cathepsin B